MKYLILLIMLFSIDSYACYSPPERYFLNPERMFFLSDGVVLAKAIKMKEPGASVPFDLLKEFEFEIIKFYINSYAREQREAVNFTVLGLPQKTRKNSDFSAHESFEFWGNSLSGNSQLLGDCNAYGSYELGKKYLIFLNVSHPKSYELIESENDRWHNLVEYIAKRYK